MATTKTISGIQRGPDFDKEAYEPARVERVERSIKEDHNKHPEANDPLIRAAVEAAKEIAGSDGTRSNVRYDKDAGLVIMEMVSLDGREVVRSSPPEEVIREAQRRKEFRAQYLESVM
jgi:uncharacterized FlaG/YvyC family protein